MLDLLVIGAGLTGLIAATTGCGSSRHDACSVVAKGLGSMHWSAGTVDVLGYLPGALSEAPCRSIRSGSWRKTCAGPSLPPGSADERLPAALALFQQSLARRGPALSRGGRARRQSAAAVAGRRGCARPSWPRRRSWRRPGPRRAHADRRFQRHARFLSALIAENLTKQGYAARVPPCCRWT